MTLFETKYIKSFLFFLIISISLLSYADENSYGCNEYEKELYTLDITGYSDTLLPIPEPLLEKVCLELKDKANERFEVELAIQKLFCTTFSFTGGVLREKSGFSFGESEIDTCHAEQDPKGIGLLVYTISQEWGCCIPQPKPKEDKKLIKDIEKEEDCCRCPTLAEVEEMTEKEDFVFFRNLIAPPFNPNKRGECRSEFEWAAELDGLVDTVGYITHIEGEPDNICSAKAKGYCIYGSGTDQFKGNTFVAIACRSK